MKRIILFFSLFCIYTSYAQSEKEKIFGFNYAFELRGSGSKLSLNNNPEFGVAEYEALPGYAFNKHFSLYLPITGSLGLFDKSNIQSYKFSGQIGLGLGYSPLHTAKDQLELCGKLGSTIGGDWHFVYYDIGVRYNFGGYNSCRNFYLGIGTRYYKCFKGDYANYCNLYVAVGFKFNFY